MTAISKAPERRGARDRNVGQPTRPASPGKNIGGRPKGGKPRSYAATPPPGLPLLPQYPTLDAPTLAALANIPDPQHKATRAANFIMHALSCGAPHIHIENHIGLQPGSLVALVLRGRELLLLYCVAEVAAANHEDAEARKILATFAGQPTSAAHARLVLNYVNSLRTSAEGRRRLSEALLRKATLPVREYDARADRLFKKVWDKLMGGSNSFAPATSVEVSTTSSDPLAAAQEILPQLRSDLDARRAAGEPGIQLVALADQVRRVAQFIKRQTAAPQPAQQQPQGSPTVPPWIAPKPKTTKPAPTHRTLDESFQATADFHRSQTEPGTVQYLKAMLTWADANLPKDDPLVKRQLASLRGRVKAVDFDMAGDAEGTERPGSAVTQPTQAPDKPGVIAIGNVRMKLKADPRPTEAPPPPTRPKPNPELEQLRAAAKRARQEAYPFPCNSVPDLRAKKLEAELAAMEAEMQPA